MRVGRHFECGQSKRLRWRSRTSALASLRAFSRNRDPAGGRKLFQNAGRDGLIPAGGMASESWAFFSLTDYIVQEAMIVPARLAPERFY